MLAMPLTVSPVRRATSENNVRLAQRTDGYNTLLHQPENPEDIASKMGCLVRDEGFRRNLAANAKRTMTDVYTADRMVGGLSNAVPFALRNRLGR